MDDIQIGAHVFLGNAEVGNVGRLIADARTARITDIVVDRGLLHADKIIPLGYVREASGGKLVLAMDRDEFDHAEGFVEEHYQPPDEVWPVPAGYDRVSFLINANFAYDSNAGYGPAAAPGPVYVPSTPDPTPDLYRPDIEVGTPIRTATGEKVGEVAEAAFDPDDGKLTRLVLKKGFLGRTDVELPLDWVDDLSSEGVILHATVEEVEQLQAT